MGVINMARTRKQRKRERQDLFLAKEQTIFNRFKKINDKSANCRACYCVDKIIKNKVIRTNESKHINQPISKRFNHYQLRNIGFNGIKDGFYKFNSDYWILEQKPKELVRLNYRDINFIKITKDIKFL